MTATSVTELQRAWRAIERGEFRARPRRAPTTSSTWMPEQPSVMVSGVTGSCGATTTALALAEASGEAVRIVECAPAYASGLAAAPTAELGVDGPWRRGDRGLVLIERLTGNPTSIETIAEPLPSDRPTIVDAGRDLAAAREDDGWLGSATGTLPLVLVTRLSAPGLRRLDHALQLADAALVVVLGPPVKKWPRAVRVEMTPRLEQLHDAGVLVSMPVIAGLETGGITGAALPRAITSTFDPFTGLITKGATDVSA